MKYIVMFVALAAFAALSQDNAQAITSPRAGVEFDAVGPDVGRGPAGYTARRVWVDGVGTVDAIVTPSGSQVPPNDGTFAMLNSAEALPIDLQPATAMLVERLANKPLPGASGANLIHTTYAPAPGFVGNDVRTITYTVNGAPYATTTITFTVANTLPTVAASTSPKIVNVGFEVLLAATASDGDGHTLTFAWDFGDGSTGVGATPSHAYAAAGLYTATITVNDGFASVVVSVVIDVAGEDRVPTARFTTSDVIAFATSPFVFDAAFSTDPQNSALSYAWDFGDGSPVGAGSLIAKIYAQPGSYAVTLTVTDGEGLRGSLTRSLEVLPKDAIGTFDAEVELTTSFNGGRANGDRVTLKAVLNVGDTILADGAEVALEVGGKRFSTQLDKRLRKTDTSGRWTVKTKLRGQPFGSVDIRASLKGSGLLNSFMQAGAVDDGELELPVRIECGGKIFDVFIPTAFQITGQRGRSSGQL